MKDWSSCWRSYKLWR